ncbi:hypothetical Protein YC6258_04310 [Gynuella sunshinyii YC6258]|uniref:Uncharacterized protein n=1 Tax=Gynuella sunshinyii YC6258 TaxID=1445510 RepID=A0A0C5W0Y5_9GAMM|nr:hypothetical Protein YC6258_04310 [Gynuella sunshinyii YC6258]
MIQPCVKSQSFLAGFAQSGPKKNRRSAGFLKYYSRESESYDINAVKADSGAIKTA